MDFSLRLDAAELMDDPECDTRQLLRTLEQFETINRFFSRYRTVLKRTVLRDMRPGREYHLVDIGAGGCDIAAWLLREAQRKGLQLRISALEPDPRSADYAERRWQGLTGLSVIRTSGENLAEHQPFDYVYANHVLHHLSDSEIRDVLSDADRLADRGAVFTDLKRSRWSYLGFWLVSGVFRDSFARTDGLISIRKGFREKELRSLAKGTDLQLFSLIPGRVNLCTGSLTNDENYT